MTIADIQKRLDALAVAMAAKGLREPDATHMMKSQSEGCVLLGWHKGASGYNPQHEHCDTLKEAEAYVASLPSPEQARMQAFMASLSETIELGKKADIDADVVNPLLDLMKRISKNAITHAEAA